MCKSKDERPPSGDRCDSCMEPHHKAVTVAKQSVNRHLRIVSDAEIIGDLDAVDKHYGLLNQSMSRLITRESDLADFTGKVPPPAPTRAAEFTYENAGEYTDNQLRSIAHKLHFDPEAQDTIQETLDRRYQESAYEAFGGELDLDEDDDERPHPAALMASVRAAQHEPTWGGHIYEDPPAADEYPPGQGDWEDSHIVYEVPDLTDAEMFRAYLRAGANGSPEEQCREAYEQWNLSQHDRAVEECAGVMLNSAGKRKGIRDYDLFMGNAAIAKKYASEELQAWWRKNGRKSYSAFRFGFLGNEADRRSWELSRMETFANVA